MRKTSTWARFFLSTEKQFFSSLCYWFDPLRMFMTWISTLQRANVRNIRKTFASSPLRLKGLPPKSIDSSAKKGRVKSTETENAQRWAAAFFVFISSRAFFFISSLECHPSRVDDLLSRALARKNLLNETHSHSHSGMKRENSEHGKKWLMAHWTR